MKKVIFRADAKASIGIGDLVSFINLSRHFEKYNWECHYIVKDYEPALAVLHDHGILNSLVIKKDTGIEQEIRIINTYLDAHNIKAIFFQINEVKLSQYNNIKTNVYKACVYFKDDLPKDYDLVLSWDIDSHKYFKHYNYPNTKFFLGPEYVILSADFDKQRVERRIYRKRRETLLLAMGGADEYNFTAKIVEKLNDLKCQMDIRIVLGAGYSHLKSLEKTLCASTLKYQIEQNVRNMFRKYMNCDVAIGTGGLTASELVFSRTPVLLLAVYEHQITRCKYFKQMGWAKYLGYRDVTNLNIEDLENFIPNKKNKFDNKIEEVVEYIDRACR